MTFRENFVNSNTVHDFNNFKNHLIIGSEFVVFAVILFLTKLLFIYLFICSCFFFFCCMLQLVFIAFRMIIHTITSFTTNYSRLHLQIILMKKKRHLRQTNELISVHENCKCNKKRKCVLHTRSVVMMIGVCMCMCMCICISNRF